MDMISRLVKSCLLLIPLATIGLSALGQSTVPLGIHYQAVARTSDGKEMANTTINVMFTILSGSSVGSPVYQEVHNGVLTSQFGVFSLIIGNGDASENKSLSEIAWDMANHWLKVEIQFDNDKDFMYMGTQKFVAVPYALYAQKSLEPGPEGPKGDAGEKGPQGDPASDNQTLSVVNVDGTDYLAIDGGNQVKISNIEKDGDKTNEIQDLVYNNATRELQITKSALGVINLTELKNDADADPANEIQDLKVTSDKLTITGKTSPTEINLGVYRDNTDNQQLSYSETNHSLAVTGGNSVTLGAMMAFRAKKTTPTTAAMPLSNVDFIPDNIEYNDGSGLNINTGEFTANYTGIYIRLILNMLHPGTGKIVMTFIKMVIFMKHLPVI